MAVDDALLESCASGGPEFPCVRFYRWAPAALSLGYHQDPDQAADRAALRAMGLDLVRRPTGGRAVLHDAELTYAVIARCRDGVLAGPVMTSYRRISEALVDGLGQLGLAATLSAGDPPAPRNSLEPCFARRSRCEVEADGAKLIGSVQLQRGGALLQHGSIPLRFDPQRLARATGGRPSEGGFEGTLAGLQVGDLVRALTTAFEARFDVTLTPGALSARETSRAGVLASERYSNLRWTRRPGPGRAMQQS